MTMKKLLAMLLATCCLTGATMLPASALEYWEIAIWEVD